MCFCTCGVLMSPLCVCGSCGDACLLVSASNRGLPSLYAPERDPVQNLLLHLPFSASLPPHPSPWGEISAHRAPTSTFDTMLRHSDSKIPTWKAPSPLPEPAWAPRWTAVGHFHWSRVGLQCLSVELVCHYKTPFLSIGKYTLKSTLFHMNIAIPAFSLIVFACIISSILQLVITLSLYIKVCLLWIV